MRTIALSLVALSSLAVADPLVTPANEVANSDLKLDLPPLPAFELPAGPLTVKRLHVAGKPLLGTRVVLHGFITYAYDCATAIRKPKETDRAVQARIDADPTLCERPKFYIGDTAGTPPDKSLWVVEVPRPYNKLELKNLPKADRNLPNRCEPNEKAADKKICPPYRVGDEVIVDGTFELTSPHSERNSDGLVVYAAMKNITRKWETPGAKLDATMVAVSGAPATTTKSASVPPIAAAPADPAKQHESIKHANAGNKALSLRQLDDARTEYRAAVQAWDGNHVAWYGLASANALDAKWSDAVDAYRNAVARAPSVAMYRMWYGIALYEDHRADDAAAQLAEAVHLVPQLWRAHYYLGRIAREGDRPREAAEQLATAIRANPRQAGPYIALGELMRRWDYTDQAIQVLAQARQYAPTSEVSLALGMAYFDRQLIDKALEAFDHALALDANNQHARFQRGFAYYKRGDYAHAKTDLEEFVKAKPPMAYEVAVSEQILADIAARSSK